MMPTTFTYRPPHTSTFTFNSPQTPDISTSRKRPHSNRNHGSYTSSMDQSQDWASLSAASSVACLADTISPAPLVDTRYLFAGGLSQPSPDVNTDRADQSEHEQYRRRWGMQSSALETQSSSRTMASSLDQSQGPGWGKLMFSLVGGVAGKMWNICTGAAFKGFYAGGGQGYELKPTSSEQQQQQNMQAAESIWEDLDSRTPGGTWNPSPLPGQYPQEAFPFTFESKSNFEVKEDTPPRPSKRMHTDAGSSWVMVSNSNDNLEFHPESPKPSTRNSFYTPGSPSQIPRPALQHRPSSYVSKRPSLIPVSRRTSLVSNTGSPGLSRSSNNHRQSSQGTPSARQRQYTRESYGIPALHSPVAKGSPLSPEVQKYAARLRREEHEADVGMSKLNAQLAALIKEGQQALQSKVDVFGGDDEGFEDGRW